MLIIFIIIIFIVIIIKSVIIFVVVVVSFVRCFKGIDVYTNIIQRSVTCMVFILTALIIPFYRTINVTPCNVLSRPSNRWQYIGHMVYSWLSCLLHHNIFRSSSFLSNLHMRLDGSVPCLIPPHPRLDILILVVYYLFAILWEAIYSHYIYC